VPVVVDLVSQVSEQQEKSQTGRGRLVVDEWMRVKGAPDILAVGDCAVIEDKPLPANAQVGGMIHDANAIMT
jgi:NADH dehydrogenase FAD-containing subunit